MSDVPIRPPAVQPAADFAAGKAAGRDRQSGATTHFLGKTPTIEPLSVMRFAVLFYLFWELDKKFQMRYNEISKKWARKPIATHTA
ncbi:MAG: hypothetical protein PHT40_00445 [Patescibacteria group bacterium]|nr:hypothetical protein [Patescibacteria group bacterium]